jgi:hypothetical protein
LAAGGKPFILGSETVAVGGIEPTLHSCCPDSSVSDFDLTTEPSTTSSKKHLVHDHFFGKFDFMEHENKKFELEVKKLCFLKFFFETVIDDSIASFISLLFVRPPIWNGQKLNVPLFLPANSRLNFGCLSMDVLYITLKHILNAVESTNLMHCILQIGMHLRCIVNVNFTP